MASIYEIVYWLMPPPRRVRVEFIDDLTVNALVCMGYAITKKKEDIDLFLVKDEELALKCLAQLKTSMLVFNQCYFLALQTAAATARAKLQFYPHVAVLLVVAETYEVFPPTPRDAAPISIVDSVIDEETPSWKETAIWRSQHSHDECRNSFSLAAVNAVWEARARCTSNGVVPRHPKEPPSTAAALLRVSIQLSVGPSSASILPDGSIRVTHDAHRVMPTLSTRSIASLLHAGYDASDRLFSALVPAYYYAACLKGRHAGAIAIQDTAVPLVGLPVTLAWEAKASSSVASIIVLVTSDEQTLRAWCNAFPGYTLLVVGMSQGTVLPRFRWSSTPVSAVNGDASVLADVTRAHASQFYNGGNLADIYRLVSTVTFNDKYAVGPRHRPLKFSAHFSSTKMTH